MNTKNTLLAAGITAILLATLIFFLPRRFSIDRYRPSLISYLEERFGREVEIGHLGLTLFPVAMHIDNFNVKNPPSFPRGYLVKVSHIDADLNFREFLHNRIVVESLLLDNPVVNLISDPDGPSNFENSPAASPLKFSPLGKISHVRIKKAQLVSSTLLPSNAQGPVIFEAHDIIGDLNEVHLAAITGTLLSSASRGQGHIKADRLSFGAVDADHLDSNVQLGTKQIFFTDATAEVYGGKVKGTFFLDLSGKWTAFRTNAQFNGVSVARVLEPFENGRGKMTGKMEGNLMLSGQIQHSHRPLAGIRGSGHVTVHDGEVPTLQLNENVMKLVRFNNLGPGKEHPSAFSSVSSDIELADLRIVTRAIDIDGYGVDIDGEGSVNVDGSDELDYRGVARITTKQGFFSNTFARFSGASLQDGLLSFPFQVRGTMELPVFARGEARERNASSVNDRQGRHMPQPR